MENNMKEAIKLAYKCLKNGDVPVAAIIYKNGKILSKAYNKKYKYKDSTAHAEILAIKKACKKLKSTHLDGCDIYITLEPCAMCASAIYQSHISRVIYCLKSPKYGALYNENVIKNIKIEQIYDQNYEEELKKFFIDKR